MFDGCNAARDPFEFRQMADRGKFADANDPEDVEGEFGVRLQSAFARALFLDVVDRHGRAEESRRGAQQCRRCRGTDARRNQRGNTNDWAAGAS